MPPGHRNSPGNGNSNERILQHGRLCRLRLAELWAGICRPGAQSGRAGLLYETRQANIGPQITACPEGDMTRRQQRIVMVALILAGVAGATALALTAIGQNMLYFFSPTQIQAGEAPKAHNVRVGGLVVANSVRRDADGLTVQFDVTDNLNTVTVAYRGILPDLFREGQGIVARGQLNDDGTFVAEEVLAKHDENYMPPEVYDALQTAESGGRVKTLVEDEP